VNCPTLTPSALAIRGSVLVRAVVGMRVKDAYSVPGVAVASLAGAPRPERAPTGLCNTPGAPCQADSVVRSWGGPVPDPGPQRDLPGERPRPAPAGPGPPGGLHRGRGRRLARRQPAGHRAQAPLDPAAVAAPPGRGNKTRRWWRAAAAFGDPWGRG
jgi:hypothetical protein